MGCCDRKGSACVCLWGKNERLVAFCERIGESLNDVRYCLFVFSFCGCKMRWG